MEDVYSTGFVVRLPHHECGNDMIRIALSYQGVEMKVLVEKRGGEGKEERGEQRRGEC